MGLDWDIDEAKQRLEDDKNEIKGLYDVRQAAEENAWAELEDFMIKFEGNISGELKRQKQQTDGVI